MRLLKAALVLSLLFNGTAWALGGAKGRQESVSKPGRITLQEAIALATEDYHREGAREWFGSMVENFSSSMDSVETACRASKGSDTGAAFTFVLRLSASGDIVETLVDHQTALSQCLQDRMSAMQFPPPIKKDFWLLVYLDFSGREMDE